MALTLTITLSDVPEADRKALIALDAAWTSIQKQPGIAYPVPDAIFNLATGWASGDTAATSPGWSSPRPIIRVNLSNHADGKALLVHLLHLAAHAVGARGEADERQRQAELRRDLSTRIAAGARVTDIVNSLGISEGMVYRARAAINEGRSLDEEEVTTTTPSSGGPYHSTQFRDAAEALGLKVSKRLVPGRGFEILADTPLATGSITRYKNEIAALGKMIPESSAPKPYRKFDPVYLNCECGVVNDERPRSLRMPAGPGRDADDNQDIVCQICERPFHLVEGAARKSGFQKGNTLSPGRPARRKS